MNKTLYERLGGYDAISAVTKDTGTKKAEESYAQV